jgi:hypothetical protein
LDNNANIKSLKLNGQGYLEENVNSTRSLSQLTISAWVKPDYSQGSSQFTIVSKERSFTLAVANNIPPIKKATFSVFDGIKWTTVNSITSPQDWTNIVATFNRTSIGIYINGTLESTASLSGVPTLTVNGKLTTKTVDNLSSNADIIIGAYFNTVRETSNNLFSGSIEDVKLYDSLLTSSEIHQLYSANPLH